MNVLKTYDFLKDENTRKMENAFVLKTGHLDANTTANNNLAAIVSYVKNICGILWEETYIDAYEQNELRRKKHNVIAAAFNVPRKLVSYCTENLDGSDDMWTVYRKKIRNMPSDKFDDALFETVEMFVKRIVEVRYEFVVNKMHPEFNDEYKELTETELDRIADELKNLTTPR